MARLSTMFTGLCLLLSPLVAAEAASKSGECNADNCARAVTGTRRGDPHIPSARADCSSFLATTVLADAVTITVTAAPSGSATAPASHPVPGYASACGKSGQYASACSCWGVTGAKVTVTPTSTVVATSTKPEPSGPVVPYEPEIPADYEKCAFNPDPSASFQMADPNTGLPIIKNGTLAKVVEHVTEDYEPPTYKPVKVAGSKGLFDLVLEEGGKSYYLAIYKSNKVGFVEKSSNGQDYVADGSDSYITSAFAFTCEGRITAGILGVSEFFFIVTDDQRVVVTTSRPAPRRRDIPVPEGFLVIPANRPAGPGKERCFPGQTPVSKGIAPTTNGCGPEGGFHGVDLVPDFNFGSCCDSHDTCFGTCDVSFGKCNTDFFSCATSKCQADFRFVPQLNLACRNIAAIYYLAISWKGGDAFQAATKKHCECKCDDPKLTACDDKCIDTQNDPENCGQCFFHCPSGTCTNGACAFDSCKGSTCGSFSACGPGGSCVCGSTSSSQGFCVNGDTPCNGLAGCGSNTDCPLGSVCIVGSCCGRNVCVATDFCGGFISKRDLLVGPTLGHLGLFASENATSEA
jgi:hypothetical protein